MAERYEQDEVFPAPRYSIEFPEYDDHAEIAMVRLPRDLDDANVFADVWTKSSSHW